jgi:hypothetical protein
VPVADLEQSPVQAHTPVIFEEVLDLPIGVLGAVLLVRAELALDFIVLADEPSHDVSDGAIPGCLGF